MNVRRARLIWRTAIGMACLPLLAVCAGESARELISLPGLQVPRAELYHAIETAHEALETAPNDADARLYLAELLCRGGEFDAAARECRLALAATSPPAGAHYLMAILLASKGEAAEAARECDAGLKKSLPAPLLLNWLYDALACGDRQNWRALQKKVVESSPPDDPRTAALAEHMAWVARLGGAVELWKAKLPEHPLAIPLRVKDQGFVLEGRIGSRRFPLRLDTGANDVCLKAETIKDIGKDTAGEETSYDLYGMEKSERRLLFGGMWLGEWRVRNIPVGLASCNLMGTDLFVRERLCITIAPERPELLVSREVPGRQADHKRVVVPFRLFNGKMMLACVLDDGSSANALFDTGCSTTLVDTSRVGSLLRGGKTRMVEVEFPLSAVMATKTVPGVWVENMNVKLAPELQIPLRKTALAIDLTEISRQLPATVDLFAGMDLFRWRPLKKGGLSIDYKGQNLVFDLAVGK